MSDNKQVKSIIPAVQFKDVVFGYDRTNPTPTVKGVSFILPAGKYICVVGGNGSGKSTISKLLAGLLKP